MTLFQKNIIVRNVCVSIFSATFVEKFVIMRRMERNMIKNVYRSSCKVTVILVIY